MQYEDIVNNLLNRINDSSNEEQCNSFKFLLMLSPYSDMMIIMVEDM